MEMETRLDAAGGSVLSGGLRPTDQRLDTCRFHEHGARLTASPVMAAVEGKLYAAGGTHDDSDGDDAIATVEVYDPQQDRWEAVAPMSNERP